MARPAADCGPGVDAFGAEFLSTRELTVRAEVEKRMATWSSPTPVGIAAQHEHLRAGLGYDMRARLGETTAPTLITVGSSAQAALPEYAHFIASRIPRAKVEILAGAPHRSMLHME